MPDPARPLVLSRRCHSCIVGGSTPAVGPERDVRRYYDTDSKKYEAAERRLDSLYQQRDIKEN